MWASAGTSSAGETRMDWSGRQLRDAALPVGAEDLAGTPEVGEEGRILVARLGGSGATKADWRSYWPAMHHARLLRAAPGSAAGPCSSGKSKWMKRLVAERGCALSRDLGVCTKAGGKLTVPWPGGWMALARGECRSVGRCAAMSGCCARARVGLGREMACGWTSAAGAWSSGVCIRLQSAGLTVRVPRDWLLTKRVLLL